MILLQLTTSPLRGTRFLKSGLSNLIQTATVTGRQTRGGPITLPKPFPYEEKKFRWYHEVFDKTIVKVCQENAKVFIVEGPIGVGKSAFCEVLAEEFDMKYIPQPTLDKFYILPSGYDLRQHDDELPEIIRSYDHKNFCVDPKNRRVAWYQVQMLYYRFYQYLDGICHLLNTGQGVILERSYFSDYVFTKAMLEAGYISKAVADAYLEINLNTSTFFPTPHLVIYLDIPVPVVQERIRTRNYSYEQNSPALTQKYLEALEKYWKKDYLVKARKDSEILIYDWTDGGDMDVVIDDIENIDFDTMRRDKKFVNWWLNRRTLFWMRSDFTNYPTEFVRYFNHRFYRVEELYIPISTILVRDSLLARLPECKYDIGYNPLMGDKPSEIFFKFKEEKHRSPKLHLIYTDIHED